MTEPSAEMRECYELFQRLERRGVKLVDQEAKVIEEDDEARPSKRQRLDPIPSLELRERYDLNVKGQPRVLKRYTPDQEGQDIQDHDVARPSNERYYRPSVGVHDQEMYSWEWISNARAPTYGSCGGCMRSGPLGKVCMDCNDKGWKNDYRMMRDGQKILDSITLAEIFGQGHEVAKADRFCTPKMQVMREYDTYHIDQTFRNLIRNKGIVFGYRERERIKRAYDEMVGDD
jgi:hypothetical protein